MVKVLVNGCMGRMGKEVVKQILESSDLVVACGVDKVSDNSSNFPIYNTPENIKETVDIIIDFSVPESTMNILEYAEKQHIPIVIATTGLNEEQTEKVSLSSKVIPVFKSANMSYEVNLMAKVVADLAVRLKGTDIEIVETHHRNKVDSPSGTALILADSINNALNNEMNYTYDRHPRREVRPCSEIGISSIRGGTEAGKHSVLFFGENESFEISHSVTSRAVFATGALKASRFLVDKPNGLYNMNDMIK